MKTTRRRGFTLMEVMIAVTIMSGIMVAIYSTLNSFLKTRDQLEIEAKAARVGPMILDLIEDDLRRAWIMNIDEDKVFEGESRILGGEHADSIVFLSSVDSVNTRRVDEQEVPSDLCETGYKLRVNPELPDVLELWRRQSFHVDEEPLEGGTYERLHDRVVSFRVRYLDTLDSYAERLERWDAKELHRLPAVVEIDMALEVVPRYVDLSDDASRVIVYHRAIPLRDDSDLGMRVHFLPPTFDTASIAQSGGAGGGGDGGQIDTDGDGVPDSPAPDGGGDPDGGGSTDGGGVPDDPFGGGGGNTGGGGGIFDDLFGGGGGG